MPAGRPTKLTPELLEKARSYLDECNDEIHTTDKGAVAYVDVNLPSNVGLAQFLGINKDTITEWCKTNAEFSVIVREIQQEQEKRLINKGLGGIYTSKALGALLTKHGYREGSDITTNDKELPQPIMQIPLHAVRPDNSDKEDHGALEED